MGCKPRVIKKLANEIDHNGYSKNTVKFESQCMKCAKTFIGHCPADDDVRFKRICNKCKYLIALRQTADAEAYL